MRKLFTLTLALLASFSLWAADPAFPSECLTLPTSTTFMSAVVFNGSNYTNKYYLSASADTLTLHQYLMAQSSVSNGKSINWMTYAGKGSNGADWNAVFGFKGSSFYGQNPQSTIRSDRAAWYRIKGASKFIALYNSASSTKQCVVSAYEITYNGETPSKSATAAVTNSKQSSNADTIQLILDSSKEYIIELTSTSTSGYKMPEVMFIAPIDRYTVTYKANGSGESDVVDDEATAVASNPFTYSGKAFVGWNTEANGSGYSYAVGDAVSEDLTLYAQWSDIYTVTYDKNGGTGTMANTQNEIVACTFTAPSGKTFKEWNTAADGKGTKYEVGAIVTSDLNLYAIWKYVPQTIFEWAKGSGAKIEADNTNLNGNDMGTMSVGSSVVARKLGSNNIDNNAQGYKLGNNDVCVEIQGTSAFAEGDTVIITGYNGGEGVRCFAVAPSTTADAVADTILTSTVSSQTANSIYKVVITEVQAGTKMRVFRKAGSTMYIKGVKVIRPAAREIASTVITLSDVKVNDVSISSDSLATLVSDHSLLLKDSYVEAPKIKFNEHTVITYADGEEPATKVKDKVYTITATINEAGKWEAAQEINSVEYTVTAAKLNSAKVYYYDGATKLGEEVVAINGNPVDYAEYQTKSYASFVDWYNNSDLAEEHKIADISALTVTANVNVYGKWTPAYASSVNIEQWVLDNGKKNTEFRTLLGDKKYIYSNINDLDSLNDEKDNRNYAYLGQKLKASNASISFLLKSGSTVNVRFGNVGADFKIYEGETANTKTSDQLSNATTSSAKVYSYTAAADIIIKIENVTDNKTLVVKQIMIDEDIASITLPDTPTAIDNTADEIKAVKFIENGQLFIRRGEKVYTITGEEVK